MKYLLYLILAPCICSAHFLGYGKKRLQSFTGNTFHNALSADVDPSVVEKRFTDAVIDNFAPVELQQHWTGPGKGQRYWVNDRFCAAAANCTLGPVFLYIGGEGPESGKHISEGMYIHDLAAEHSALLVTLEHRYYGESYPTPKMTTAELTHLSSAQALADIARFIPALRSEYGIASDAKLISFGGSYPGSLSAWFRLKYPHLVDGAIASSAPLIAKLEFPEYMDVCAQALQRFGGAPCLGVMIDAVNTLYDAMQTKIDVQAVVKDFNTCTQLKTKDDQWVFISNLMGDLQGAVQYNRERGSALNVTDVCSILTGSTPTAAAATPVHLSESLLRTQTYTPAAQTQSSQHVPLAPITIAPYTQLVALNRAFRAAANDTCLESSWGDMIGLLKNTTFNGEEAARQWQYQTCNEFGWFQTAESSAQPFFAFRDTLNTESFLRLCREAYGIAVVPQTSYINAVYGGLNISSHRAAYPSGSLDPWSAIALVETAGGLGSGESTLYINGTAHCADMHSGAATLQTPELTAARSTVSSLISTWLSTEDQCNTGSGGGGSGDDDDSGRHGGVGTGAAWAIALSCFFGGAGFAVLAVHLVAKRRSKRETELTRARVMREPLLGGL